MSSPIARTTPLLVAAKATKTRKPTLPDKYGKFIQFAYYMMNNVLGEDFQMDKDAYLEKIKFFGSVEEQQILVQGFLDSAKENKNTIKKVIADRNKAIAKANKPVKQKQSRAKKTNDETDGAEAPAKRSRSKASKKVNTVQDDLLNELVQLARDDTPMGGAETQPDNVDKTPEPKEVKSKSVRKSAGKKNAGAAASNDDTTAA
jgi:hypothetical protein